ncbi:MAG: helix-turn-helix domain-containing protein, partial [Treponema sp.]|nr:helix-turn-helix domain-containing protein [Treponema sp.]
KPANISELAEEFSLPLSTAAYHVQVLEETGLIFTEGKPGRPSNRRFAPPCPPGWLGCAPSP